MLACSAWSAVPAVNRRLCSCLITVAWMHKSNNFTCITHTDLDEATVPLLTYSSLTQYRMTVIHRSVYGVLHVFSVLCSLPAADAGRPSQARLRPEAWVPESASGPQPLWPHPSPLRFGTTCNTVLRCRWVCVRALGRQIDGSLATVTLWHMAAACHFLLFRVSRLVLLLTRSAVNKPRQTNY